MRNWKGYGLCLLVSVKVTTPCRLRHGNTLSKERACYNVCADHFEGRLGARNRRNLRETLAPRTTRTKNTLLAMTVFPTGEKRPSFFERWFESESQLAVTDHEPTLGVMGPNLMEIPNISSVWPVGIPSQARRPKLSVRTLDCGYSMLILELT